MYEDNININFHRNKMIKQNLSHKCVPLIMLDSVVRINEKYFSQTPLEKCKYNIENNKRDTHIDYDFNTSSSEQSDSQPDNELDSKPNNESEKSSNKSDNNECDNESDILKTDYFFDEIKY